MSPTDRLNAAPRCHATSKRTGNQCQGPAVRGWRVCRFHANGAYRSGLHTKEAIASRKQIAALLKSATKLTAAMGEGEPVNASLILMEDAL
jgi:hypothetical protein